MENFKTQFTLSRDYLGECYDQSLPYGKSPKSTYVFALLTLVGGTILLGFTTQPKVIGTLLIALGVLELIHIRFKRAWWLQRQMWSRSGNSLITLYVNDDGIETENPFTKTKLLWKDIEKVIETELGIILVNQSGGQQYLSKSLFTAQVLERIKSG